jgi:SAM-dependent methyltransferase
MNSITRSTYSNRKLAKDSALNYSLRRQFVDEFFFQRVTDILPCSKVLDLGGHKIKKRGKFHIQKHNPDVTFLNLSTAKMPDIQADAKFIPLENGSYDVVVCAELLEHVADPKDILLEIHRVLRCDGKVLITVPFLHPIHGDPFDIGRYTDYYWRNILDEIGFDEITIDRHGMFFVVILNFIVLYVNKICRKPFRNLIAPFLGLIRKLVLMYEEKDKVKLNLFFQSFTTGFGIQGYKACRK